MSEFNNDHQSQIKEDIISKRSVPAQDIISETCTERPVSVFSLQTRHTMELTRHKEQAVCGQLEGKIAISFRWPEPMLAPDATIQSQDKRKEQQLETSSASSSSCSNGSTSFNKSAIRRLSKTYKSQPIRCTIKQNYPASVT